MPEVYKVVTMKHGEPWSYTLGPTYSIKYKLNEWVKPSIGYIFIFDSLISAALYVQDDPNPTNVKIYRAKADKVITPTIGQDWDVSIPTYWEKYALNKSKPILYHSDRFPEDTKWTNKLMLVELML
jgi:hypothetical protein